MVETVNRKGSLLTSSEFADLLDDVKTVSRITYTVLVETLNPAQSVAR